MIFVSRIVGESYDLNTGKELPKGIALSNGKEEVLLFVPDDIIAALIRMSKTYEKPVVVPDEPSAPAEPPRLSDVRLNPKLPQVVALPEELPEEAPPQDDGPGEDYDDPTTGVASL